MARSEAGEPVPFRRPVGPQRAGEDLTPYLRASTIGADLRHFCDQLLDCADILATSLSGRGEYAVAEVGQMLRGLTCKIAVVGQIKAGKSTFINALIGRPGFLPTHVNPWTTAITHLHFGRPDEARDLGARFTFFDRNEWENLATGGGRLRELTERLVPGFEPELLRHQLAAMRQRTQKRLGADLDGLLGQAHEFPSPSRTLLDRYVCAGPESADPAAPPVYSDIVKSADIFFPGADFGFPTTLIDTPGTNDPFVVRDEITRRALDSADLYVVVLTARDPLSQADLSLLRILRGLHKDKIAIFVNRIDEFSDIANDAEQVALQVRARLRNEFPGGDLPIVVGSAKWALAALEPQERGRTALMSPRVQAYAAHLGLARISEQPTPERVADGLLRCSGLPALNRVLAHLSTNSHAGHVLRQVSRSFLELSRYSDAALREEVERVRVEARHNSVRFHSGHDELQQIHAEVEENQRLTNAVHALVIDLQSRTDQLIKTHDDHMSVVLTAAVRRASSYECAKLHRALLERAHGDVWQVETDGIRRLVRETFLSTYRETQHDLSQVEAYILPRLRSLVAEVVDTDTFAANDLSHSPELPSMSALGDAVTLDLSEPWWRRWWATRSSTVEARVQELEQLVTKEFEPIAQALAETARVTFRSQQTAMVQRASMIFLNLVEYVQQQSEERLGRMRQLVAEREAIAEANAGQDHDVREQDLQKRLADVSDVIKRLEVIDMEWIQSGQRPN